MTIDFILELEDEARRDKLSSRRLNRAQHRLEILYDFTGLVLLGVWRERNATYRLLRMKLHWLWSRSRPAYMPRRLRQNRILATVPRRMR
jgi:hypothetical protein